MKKLLIVLALSLLGAVAANAQTVYSCQYKSDADIVIYFTQYKSDAGWQNKSKLYKME